MRGQIDEFIKKEVEKVERLKQRLAGIPSATGGVAGGGARTGARQHPADAPAARRARPQRGQDRGGARGGQPGTRRRAPGRDRRGAAGAQAGARARARQAGGRRRGGARPRPGDRGRPGQAATARVGDDDAAGSRGGARPRPSGRRPSASAPTTSRARRRASWAGCRGWRRPSRELKGASSRMRQAGETPAPRRLEGRRDRRARRRRPPGQAARFDAGPPDGRSPASGATRSASPAPTNRARRAPGARSCSTR